MTGIGKLVRGVLIAGAFGLLAACNEDGSGLVPTAPEGENALATSSGSGSTQSAAGQGLAAAPQAPVARVTCEKQVPPRSPRSKISVDGNNLARGRYRGRVTSPPGSNPVVSASVRTIGDEVEFDFDSKVDPGETPIPANYIQIVPGGPDVLGEILDAAGNVVFASQAVDCQVR